MTRHVLLGALLLASPLVGACRYDFDEIFEGQVLDDVPDQLIELWKDKPFFTYSDACATCAASKCGAVNESCKADAKCVGFTKCVAASTDPVTQSACRAEYADWLAEDVLGRDVAGPYGQCVLQDQCTEECGSRTNFSCVNQFVWPTTGETDLPFRFRFNEPFTGEQVAGMTVKVCRADDLYCTSPTFTGVTDENGEIMLQLRTALRTFQGYLELTKKTDSPETSIYPTLLRLGWPITQEGVTNVTVIAEWSVGLNVELSQVQPDPNRGLLQVRFFSCTGYPAPNVSFTTTPADEASRIWYAGPDGIPDFNETKTFTIGAAGVINAIEGRHVVTATYSPDNGATVVKVGETATPVRAGYMSIVLVPTLGN